MNIDRDREWQAQERALQEEGSNAPATHDPLVARYRVIARALRQPLPAALPDDFAERVAARVAHAKLDTRVEQGLMRALVALLALSGAVVAAVYGAGWVQAIATVLSPLSGTAANWMLALAACVAMTWSLQALGRGDHADRGGHAA